MISIFLALLLGQFQPAAFLEGVRGFLALLDHLRQDGEDFLVADRVLAGAPIGDCHGPRWAA